MSPSPSMPRFTFVSRDAARVREEQNRFELITMIWDEARLRQACDKLSFAHDALDRDQMQNLLVAKQVHMIEVDDMQADETGKLAWPDPFGVFK